MKKTTLFILFLLTASVFAGSDQLEKAKEYNNAGYKKYTLKKYVEAEELFKKAISLYPGYVYANYNLACTYALAPSCEFKKGQRQVYSYLAKAIELDSSLKAKALQDEDFKSYYQDYNFLKITKDIKTDQDKNRLLLEMGTIKVCGDDACDNYENYVFKKDKTFEYTKTERKEEPVDQGEVVTIYKETSKQGKFSIEKGKLILKVNMFTVVHKIHGEEHMITDDYYETPKLEEYNPDEVFSMKDRDDCEDKP